MVANKIKFEPLHGFVLVKPIPRTQSHGGIHIPENAEPDGEPDMAEVIRVGPGEETETGHRREMPVQPGDHIYIYFPRHAAPAELEFDGKKYLVVQAKHIVGKVLI